MASGNSTGGSSIQPVSLLGPDGEPITSAAPLAEADRFESLLSAYDGYLAASYKLPPFNPDNFIASKGFKVLDDMLAMSAVRAPLDIVRDAVLYKGWRVTPAVNDRADANYKQASELANALEAALSNIQDEAGNCYDFRQDIYELLYAIHTGFRVSEIQWRYLEEGAHAGKLGFAMFAHKPCKQIGFDLDPRTLAVRNITSYTPLEGYDFSIPVEKVLRYTFSPRDSLPFGQGIGRVVYKHSWTLDFLYRFWNIALETFGSPFILAKSPMQSIGLARQIVQQIRQGAAPVLPTGVEAELIEISGGGLTAFKQAAEHHSQQIAYGYLHNTLTTGEGQRSGSMALGQVHENTQEYGLAGRRGDIENVLNRQLARRWTRYNYGSDAMALCPVISLGDWDEADMAQMATAFQKLIDSRVMHPAEDQIRASLGLEPIDPDLRQIMEAGWNASPNPSPIPGSGTEDPPPPAEES